MSVNDPYKVLEISPEATDEEVKTAYREMARKYHPDNYANNPLSDLAQEKMQEINEAYDTIIRMRKQGGSGQAGGGSAARSTRFGRPSGQSAMPSETILLAGKPTMLLPSNSI